MENKYTDRMQTSSNWAIFNIITHDLQLTAGNFSLHNRVQKGSGAHPASYPIDTRGSFPGGKPAGAWSWPLTSI